MKPKCIKSWTFTNICSRVLSCVFFVRQSCKHWRATSHLRCLLPSKFDRKSVLGVCVASVWCCGRILSCQTFESTGIQMHNELWCTFRSAMTVRVSRRLVCLSSCRAACVNFTASCILSTPPGCHRPYRAPYCAVPPKRRWPCEPLH